MILKIWKEVQEDGKKKDRWDGNGKERELEEKKERERIRFKTDKYINGILKLKQVVIKMVRE